MEILGIIIGMVAALVSIVASVVQLYQLTSNSDKELQVSSNANTGSKKGDFERIDTFEKEHSVDFLGHKLFRFHRKRTKTKKKTS